MGSGNSRLNPGEGGDVLPPKARSTLLGRFEDFRKRRMGGAGTLSKKNLLKDAEESEDGNSRNSHETETEDNKVLVPKEKVITTEKLSRVVPIPNPECEIEEKKDHVNQHTDSNKGKTEQVTDSKMGNIDQGDIFIYPNQGKVIHVGEKAEAEVKTEERNIAEKTEVIHVDEKVEAEVKTEEAPKKVEEPKQEIKKEGVKSNDDSDDDEDDEELGRFLCPGSPSFRIYCIEAEKRKDEDCKSPTIVMRHQKSRSADNIESSASKKSINDVLPVMDVEIESTAKGKGKKSKKFGPVKKLLKVKSCYHPLSSCTGEDRAHLIAANAAH